jgi:tetratricopeptide (TPR) repeat protein
LIAEFHNTGHSGGGTMGGDKSIGTLQLEKVGPDEWKFDHPPTEPGLEERLDRGIDLMAEGEDTKAEKIFRSVIKACPHHIDAHHHLALLLFNRGDVLKALKTWITSAKIGGDCLPEEFIRDKGRLEWLWLENRPYLRACNGLGCCFLLLQEFDSARKIFKNLLIMNPNDNQGVRALAIKTAFAMGNPAEALEVCDRYKDDILVDTLYGRPLALFQMGKMAQAKKALSKAIDAYPLVARELLKKRHRVRKDYSPTRITMGGADEAYDYWMNLGEYWKQTQGALDFLMGALPAERETQKTGKVIPFRRSTP